MTAVSNTNVSGHNDQFQDDMVIRPPNPKFDIYNASPMTPDVRMIVLNEEAARRLYNYVEDCALEPGDEWLWALIQRLRSSFASPPKLPEKRFGGRRNRGQNDQSIESEGQNE
jgi:hypothetical protein